MSEPKHDDVAEPIEEDEPTETEVVAEPTDEGAADSESDGARHRSATQHRRRGVASTLWVALAALLLALIALAGTAWALFQPSWLPKPSKLASAVTTSAPATNQQTAPQFTDQQVADAKARACGAFNTASQALAVQTGADVGKDPIALLSKAANGRVAMAAGSRYLLERLDPATPAPLATAVRSYSDQLLNIAVHSMTGVGPDDPAQDAEKRDIDAVGAQIVDLCK